MRSNAAGVLVISVDWRSEDRGAPRAGSSRDHLADKLLRLFDRYSVPTTWAIDSRTNPSIADMVRRAGCRHEIGLLADPDWASPQVSRRLFADALSERLNRVRAQGIEATSVIWPRGVRPAHVDLLVQQRVNAIRTDTDVHGRRRLDPHPVQEQLWNIPASRTLPEPAHWLWGSRPMAQTRRAVHGVAQSSRNSHIVIDGRQMEQLNASGMRAVEYLLKGVTAARQAEQLTIETMAQVVLRRTRPRIQPPARSILRRAA